MKWICQPDQGHAMARTTVYRQPCPRCCGYVKGGAA